jgi:hypothetical protein
MRQVSLWPPWTSTNRVVCFLLPASDGLLQHLRLSADECFMHAGEDGSPQPHVVLHEAEIHSAPLNEWMGPGGGYGQGYKYEPRAFYPLAHVRHVTRAWRAAQCGQEALKIKELEMRLQKVEMQQ